MSSTSLTAESVNALVDSELGRLRDQRVVAHIRSLLVTPRAQQRAWDYGEPGQSYPCWLVLAHRPSNTGIAYCEHGFGPKMPWGLLTLEGTEHMSMGMDSGWFDRFPDAYFESHASADLPIWRVFECNGVEFPGTPITAEGAWDATWAEVKRLRSERPGLRYNCWQSVYARDD